MTSGGPGGSGEPGGSAERARAVERSVGLTVIARQAGVEIVHVERYLEFGLFDPSAGESGAGADAERFPPAAVARVARAERLRIDLGLNHAGAVVVVELLDRISELERRLR